MKLNILFMIFLFSIHLFSTDFEIEIMSAGDGSETKIFKFSDNITYRHFYSHQNWKDNLGDWGTLECAGNHTIIKNKGTILKILFMIFERNRAYEFSTCVLVLMKQSNQL